MTEQTFLILTFGESLGNIDLTVNLQGKPWPDTMYRYFFTFIYQENRQKGPSPWAVFIHLSFLPLDVNQFIVHCSDSDFFGML